MLFRVSALPLLGCLASFACVADPGHAGESADLSSYDLSISMPKAMAGEAIVWLQEDDIAAASTKVDGTDENALLTFSGGKGAAKLKLHAGASSVRAAISMPLD